MIKRLLLILITSLVCTFSFAQTERGKASYYGRKAEGRKTASGERLHNDSLVCAHRKHKFGTMLRVKNLRNGKEVVVRVIDRGPFSKTKIIDLSYGAAQALDMIRAGVVPCEVTPVTEEEILNLYKKEENEKDSTDYCNDSDCLCSECAESVCRNIQHTQQ